MRRKKKNSATTWPPFPPFRKTLFLSLWLVLSLSFSCFSSRVCGSVCLQRSSLPQHLHSHIGLITPQGAGPWLLTVAVIAFTPIPLSCSRTSCSCWHSWRFHHILLLLPLIYLWHTHPVTPLALAHILQTVRVSLPNKAAFLLSFRARGQWMKEDFRISCPDVCVMLYLEVRFLHKPIITISYLGSPPHSFLVLLFMCPTAMGCIHAQVSSCPWRSFLEFMVTIMASASVFYEAAGGVDCQASWHCVWQCCFSKLCWWICVWRHVCLSEQAAHIWVQ